MKENDYVKSYRRLKATELLLVLVLEVLYLGVLFFYDSLRTAVYTNKLLFALCFMMWILMAAVLVILLIDFMMLRSTASQTHELSEAAYLDNLTGLPNRYSVDMMIRLHDTAQTMESLGCAILRISNLIQINDEYGHDLGDVIIQDFCTILNNVGSNYGFVGRNGGNEYLAIIEKCDDDKMTQFIADLYVELNLYNLSHASTPIELEYNYALNAQENTSKMTDLLGVVYRKLEEVTLS